jgi:hypothetical protein
MINLQNYVTSASKTISGITYTLLVDSKGNTLIERNEGSATIDMYCMMTTPNNGTEVILGQTVTIPATADEITAAIETFWTGAIQTYNYTLLFEIQG